MGAYKDEVLGAKDVLWQQKAADAQTLKLRGVTPQNTPRAEGEQAVKMFQQAIKVVSRPAGYANIEIENAFIQLQAARGIFSRLDGKLLLPVTLKAPPFQNSVGPSSPSRLEYCSEYLGYCNRWLDYVAKPGDMLSAIGTNVTVVDPMKAVIPLKADSDGIARIEAQRPGIYHFVVKGYTGNTERVVRYYVAPPAQVAAPTGASATVRDMPQGLSGISPVAAQGEKMITITLPPVARVTEGGTIVQAHFERNGKPVASEEFVLTVPNGQHTEIRTDSHGDAYIRATEGGLYYIKVGQDVKCTMRVRTADELNKEAAKRTPTLTEGQRLDNNRLIARAIWKSAVEGTANSNLDTVNPVSGYKRSDARGVIAGFEKGSTAYEAYETVLARAGPRIGIEIVGRAAGIAAARGDSAQNFYLYLDEVSFRFRDFDGISKSTGGRFAQGEIFARMKAGGKEIPLKITEEAAKQFFEDRGHMVSQVESYREQIMKAGFGYARGKADADRLSAIANEMRGLNAREQSKLEDLYAEAEKLYSFFMNAKAGTPVEAPKEPEFQSRLGGLLALGRGKRGEGAVLSALEGAGAIASNEKGMQFDARMLSEAGQDNQSELLSYDIKANRMNGRVERYCSTAACVLLQQAGVVEPRSGTVGMYGPTHWLLSKDAKNEEGVWGKLSKGQKSELEDALDEGRLYRTIANGKTAMQILAEMEKEAAVRKPAPEAPAKVAPSPTKEAETASRPGRQPRTSADYLEPADM
jgi:biotin carboxyl carrier protein